MHLSTLKDLVSATLCLLLVAPVVVLASADQKPEVGDKLYAMITIRQPLKIDEKVFENHEIGGTLYASSEGCMEAANTALQQNAAEMLNGSAAFRVFAGCITIPSPGKFPVIGRPKSGLTI